MYNSFYGGRPTSPFVISKNYDNIDDMITDFKNGDKCDVKYGQYVIIDDLDKTEHYVAANADITTAFGSESKVFKETMNGQLFKRGVDYTNAVGGAIYIGNIAGPTGAGMNIVEVLIYGEGCGNNIGEAIQYLNTKYPDGYEEKSVSQEGTTTEGTTTEGTTTEGTSQEGTTTETKKIDTSAFILYKEDETATNGDLYCYADSNKAWYFVGKLNNPDCFVNVGSTLPADISHLSDAADNAAWFVVKKSSDWRTEK